MDTIGSCNKISSIPSKTYSRKRNTENKTAAENSLKQFNEILVLDKNQETGSVKKENETHAKPNDLPGNSNSKNDASDFYTFNCEKTENALKRDISTKPVGKNSNEKRLLIYSPRNTERKEVTHNSPSDSNKKLPPFSSVKDSSQKSINKKPTNSAKDGKKQDYKCSSKAILLSSVITLSRDWSASRKTYARHTSPPVRVQSRNNYDSFINKDQEKDNKDKYDSSERDNEKVLNNSSYVNNSFDKSASEKNFDNELANMENNKTVHQTTDKLNDEKTPDNTSDSFCSFFKNDSVLQSPENSHSLKQNCKKSQKSVSFAEDGCIDLPQSSLKDRNVNIENPYNLILCEDNDNYVNNISDISEQLNDKNQNEDNEEKERSCRDITSSNDSHGNSVTTTLQTKMSDKPKGKRGRPRKIKEATEKPEAKTGTPEISSADDQNSSTPKPVRKRGRPRKILDDKSQDQSHNIRNSFSENCITQSPEKNITTPQTTETSKITVRKRGRPRKHPLVCNNENSEENTLSSTDSDEKRLRVDLSKEVNGKLCENENSTNEDNALISDHQIRSESSVNGNDTEKISPRQQIIETLDLETNESNDETSYRMENVNNLNNVARKQNQVEGKINKVHLNKDHLKQKDTLMCGVCKEEFDSLPRIKYHIMAAHNGLARINDENSYFTPQEEIVLYKKNLRLIKRLSCTQPHCGKKFSSILGYKYHKNICGVEVQRTECKICGKFIKVISLALHIRTAHRERQEVQPTTNQDLPRRGAAIKAIEKLESFMRIEKESPEDEESNKDESDDSEYLQSEEEQEKKEEFTDSEDYYDEDGESRYFFMELLDPWKGLFYTPSDQMKEISETMITSWEKSLIENGKISCDKMNCNKEFSELHQMKCHYRHCGSETKKWMCRICGKSYSMGPLFLYNHMKKCHFNEDINDYNDKDGKSLYSDFHQPPSSTYNYAARGSLLKPYAIAMEWALKFFQKHNKTEVFSQWKPFSSDWIQMLEREYKDYLPSLNESSNLRIASDDEHDSSWIKINLFENIQSESKASSSIFFAGGAVWSISWCPNPLGVTTDQFLALAACDPEAHYLTDTKKCKGMIQLWDVGNLENNFLTKRPKLALAIAHENGEIWDLTWCPSGCWEEVSDLQNDGLKKSGNKLPRLGLLAAACSDGTVKIYSIPQPYCLTKNEGSLPIFKPKADVILVPPENGPNISCHRTICTKVSWQRTNSHSHVAAGYGSGLVCIWNLMSSSPLLIVSTNYGQLTLCPFMSFPAHSACITALLWLPIPGNRYIATAGYDKTAKVWDLQDQYWPSILNDKRGLVRDLAWLPHWCGMFESMDECYNLFHTSTIYKECGYYSFLHKVLSVHFSTIWSLSVSDWLNVEASGSASGDMVIVVLCQLMKYVDHIKQMGHRRVPLYRISMEALNDVNENDDVLSVESDKSTESTENLPKIKKKTLPTYKEAVKTYGLVFQDNNFADFGEISTSEFQRVLKSENMSPSQPNLYPLASINKVAWNPNFGSHLWLVSASQAGLIKLSCISGLNSKELKGMFVKCKEACRTQTKDL
ncbi:uncharacterized protein [Centruroides vittatus]|uniref:uncharacterized protein n=1 Tax=Centruroides vittatus TaxID=120091 RepID=UPI00350F8AD2